MNKREILNALLAPSLELLGIKSDSETTVTEQRISESLFPWISKEPSAN